jgi:PAS domain S-box-containing protein
MNTQLQTGTETEGNMITKKPFLVESPEQANRRNIKRQQDALHDSYQAFEEANEQYMVLHDSTPAGYFTLNEQGLITDMNLIAATLLGQDSNVLQGSSFARHVSTRDVEHWHECFLDILANNHNHGCELKLQRKDGSVFIANLNCLHTRTFDGEHFVRVAVHDITGKKQLENQLRDEEKNRAIFEGALDGILLVDAVNKKITSCNPAFCRMLGYSQSDIIRLGILELHPQQDVPRILEGFARHLRGETAIEANIPFKRRDGSIFYADITSAPVHLAGKVYLVVIIRDITGRRHTEEQLRLSTLKYQMLFNDTHEALLILSQPDWKVSDANKAALKLFGVSSIADLAVLILMDIFKARQADNEMSVDKLEGMIAVGLRDGYSNFEWKCQHCDGQFRFDVSLTRIKSGNEVYLLVNMH